MAGNQLLQPQNRLMIAATLFALAAIATFVLVLKWPGMFGIEVAEEASGELMTAEEKMAVLAQLRSSEPEAFGMSAAEKDATLDNLNSSNPDPLVESSSEASQKQKLEVLSSLNAQ